MGVTARILQSIAVNNRLAPGHDQDCSWFTDIEANGEIVSLALSVLQEAIIKSVGDVCKKEALVRDVTDLTFSESSPSHRQRRRTSLYASIISALHTAGVPDYLTG